MALARPPAVTRTPTVLQMEASECGAACLAILLRHHGREVPLLELRQACGVSRDGSDAASLLRAAALYGLEGKGYRMEIEALRQRAMPVILFWRFNHFVVLEGFRGDRVAINDPAVGRRWLSLAAFRGAFTGVVLELAPGPGFRRGGRLPGAWALLGRRLGEEKAAVLFFLLASLLLIGPQLALPIFSQIYIDEVWGAGLQAWLKPLLWLMVAVIALQGAGAQLQRFASRHLSRRLDSRGALAFERHVLALPEPFFQQRYAGDISQRVLLNREVASFIAGRLLPLASGLVLLVFYLLLTLAYSPRLALVVGVGTALNAVVVQLSLRRQRDATLQLEQEGGKTAAVLVAALRDIDMVKSTATEADVLQRFAGHQSRLAGLRHRLALDQGALALLPGLLSQLITLGVLVVGFQLVLAGQLTLGMLLAAQQVAAGLKAEVDRLVAFLAELPGIETAVLRLQDVLDQPIDPLLAAPPVRAWPAQRSRLSGAVEIRDLRFAFAPVQQPLIHDLSLKIEPGQRLALVGASGSGKSTVAHLIAGLLQPTAGKILYDGLPLAAVPRAVAVASLALVQQEITLYGMSVRENLQLWRPLPEELLRRVCGEVRILEAIEALPDGFDTVLAEGARNFSGGQRQRLEIARALLQDPSILILDEATSALDGETERLVDEALRRRACTQILVAHRLSTIRDADRILVLDRGRVVQQGRHEALLAEAEGPYAGLVAEGML
jgi:NHLM bacteriocin system ABC transporter peptidase/ATP-binding protein